MNDLKIICNIYIYKVKYDFKTMANKGHILEVQFGGEGMHIIDCKCRNICQVCQNKSWPIKYRTGVYFFLSRREFLNIHAH